MKTLYKTLFLLFLVVLLWPGSITKAQNPVVTINYNTTGLTSGQSIAVPVMISGNVNMGSVQLEIFFDSDYLTYVSISAGSGFGGIIAYPNVVNDSTEKLIMSWSNIPNVYCTNNLFCNINFVFNGGSGIFDFNESACELAYFNGLDPVEYENVTYNNGSYAGSYGTLTSVAGGGTWSAAATWQENSGGGTQTPSRAFNIVITGLEVTVTGNSKCRSLSINPTGVLKVNTGVTLTTLSDCLIR